MASNDSRAKLEQAEANDEDIFEGLAKRKSERIPAPPLSAPPRSSMVVPAAPPPPPGSVDARRTLLGLDDSPPPPSVRQEARQEARREARMSAEERTEELYEEPPISQMPNSDTFRAALRAAPPPSFAPPPPTATSPALSNLSLPASAPPPPPGRGTLPRITVPPPPPSGNMAAAAPAPPPMEADWDDDKETLVYDKDNNPASLMPPPSGVPSSRPPSVLPQVKKTLVGVSDASARSFGESSPSSPSLSLSRTLNSANNPITTPLSMPAQVRTEPLPIPVRPRPSFAALNNAESQRAPAPPIAAPSEPIVLPTNAGSSKAWLFGALGLLGLGLAAVGAFVALSPAKPGRLQVRVADARGGNADRVEIFVDGKKACDTSPCIVEGLSAGEHQVKLMAAGMETVSQSAVLVSGRELELPLALLPIKGAAPVAAAPEAATAAAAPAAVTKGKVTLKLETEGAQVFLVDGSERRRVTELPSTIDALDMSKAWTLEATKPGFADFRLPLTFAAGETEKTVSIALEPLAKGASAQAATAAAAHVEAKQTPAAAAAPAPAPAAPKTAAPAPASAEAKAAPTAAAAQTGEGTLNLNSMPASAVIVDGRPVGQTPVLGLSVPSGNHTIVFMNSDQNLKKTLRVSVKQGETKAVVGKLRE